MDIYRHLKHNKDNTFHNKHKITYPKIYFKALRYQIYKLKMNLCAFRNHHRRHSNYSIQRNHNITLHARAVTLTFCLVGGLAFAIDVQEIKAMVEKQFDQSWH